MSVWFSKAFNKTFVSSEFDKLSMIMSGLNKYLRINTLFDSLFDPEIKIFSFEFILKPEIFRLFTLV